MNDVPEALAAWKNQTIARTALLRVLLEYENWMMPMNAGVNSFGPFTLALPKLIADVRGQSRILLFADGDAQDAFAAPYQATGGIGFANPTGWEIFSVALDGVDAVVFDLGTPHEFTVPAAEFAEFAELAEAVAVEAAWRRLRKGNEEEGDVARVARYPGYHLAVVRREEGLVLIHVPHDDNDTKCVPVFTHSDALALAIDEFREGFAPAEVKTIQVSGAKAFPVLANENADGIVFNFRGPGEPIAFQLGITGLMIEELAKTPAEAPVAGSPAPQDDDGTVIEEITNLSNEGVELTQTERSDEAEALLRRALVLAEEKLRADHPSTAACLNNLGDFLSQNGRLDEAEPILRLAVAAEEAANGADHVRTGTALNNLALVLRRMKRLADAEPLYRRVLAIFEEAHGPEHINVGGVLNNLSQGLQHTGRSAEAEPLMRRAIGIFENHFGEDHPSIAIALNNLARLMEETGRAAEAEPLSRRHLRIFQAYEDSTGNRHAYMDSAIDCYGDLLVRLGLSQQVAQARIDAILAGRDPGDLGATPNGPDFDRLSRKANEPDAAIEDKNALFAATFKLTEWHFIARGELPDVRPYIAANPEVVDGAPMLKAFTETAKLHAFAKECGLTGQDGEVSILALPVAGILPMLAGYADQGVTHIHFNADQTSDGFYVPLVQMPIIRRHLGSNGLL